MCYTPYKSIFNANLAFFIVYIFVLFIYYYILINILDQVFYIFSVWFNISLFYFSLILCNFVVFISFCFCLFLKYYHLGWINFCFIF